MADVKALWVRKQQKAEDKLREIQAQKAANLAAYGETCKFHGGSLCADLLDGVRKAAEEQAKLEAHLTEGLEEECRRDPDCLPGYLRD